MHLAGMPDLTRKLSIPLYINKLFGAHTHGEPAGLKGIVGGHGESLTLKVGKNEVSRHRQDARNLDGSGD
jgi:hypothetical protein